MARVPTYDSFRVSANTLPANQVSQFQMPQAPDIVGRQAQQMGQAITGAGQQLGMIATKAQQQANQVRLDDAMNRVKEEVLRLTFDQEAGYSNLHGINALERPDGKPLADEYESNLAEFISTVAGELGNDVQRAAFTSAADGVLTDFRGRLLKHESDEFHTYALSVSEGVQATALREIALSWDDPEAIDKAVKRIRAHTYRQAQLLGRSAEWQEAQVRKMTSTAHRAALTAALENNHAIYADSYLNRHAREMEADDILHVQGHITKTIDLQVGDNIGAEVFATFAPQVAPGDFSRLTNIVMGLESNGRRYDEDGNLLEGPMTRYGTAKGEMQVLDSTNTDPGYGVKPAQDDSPEERARVGRDYLSAMLKEYKGDIAKALAAYNWGPGNVDAAVKEHGLDWLNHAPSETRNYVANALNRYGTGAGSSPKPTLGQMKAVLRAQPELMGNPERLKHAESRLEADFKDLTDAIEQRESEALDSAYREVYANGGNFAALPPEIRIAIPGDKIGSVMSFADKVNKNGGAVHSPEAWARILSTPREILADMSPIDFFKQFRPVLDDSHLEKGYALLEDAKGVSGENHLEIITTATRVKNAAIIAGILPESGAPDKDEIEAFTQFSQLIDSRVRQFERVDLQGQRKANSEELQNIIDGVFLDQAFVPRRMWWDSEQPVALMSPEDQERAYVTVEGEDIPLTSIPMDQRLTITSKLRTRGLPVTEQAIAELWVRAGKPN